MFNFIKTGKLLMDKQIAAARENIDLRDYMNSLDFTVVNHPFPHVIVDNFFKDIVYKNLLKHFNEVINKGFSKENDPTRFHPFLDLKDEFAYDGYVHTLKHDEIPGFKIFASPAWNLFFSKLFTQPTGWCTNFAYHYHPPGDRTGFVHHDYAHKTFSVKDRLTNGVIFKDTGKNSQDPALFKQMRVIALLYYLGNDSWMDGDGGETGFYLSKNTPPVKMVAPINNRLLAFNISPRSFHAFQKNFKPRASIVQWFHMDPSWCKDKYGFL